MIQRPRAIHLVIASLAIALSCVANVAHAQLPQLLSQPTGSCPNYLAAEKKQVQKDGQTVEKIVVSPYAMQCKQGMCWRPATAGQDATIRTDIPCNYSVDDIFVTVLNGVRIIFALTGAIALAIFVYGGFKYWILSRGDAGKVKEGKSLMVNSIIAICLTFSAGTIVTFVTRSLGAEIGVDSTSGAVGQIVADPDTTPDCPINGRQGQICGNTENEEDADNVEAVAASNMACYYGPEVATGDTGPTEGICISKCQYEALHPDGALDDDEYQCTDRSLLNPAQQRSCKPGLCPGAANMQCCKL